MVSITQKNGLGAGATAEVDPAADPIVAQIQRSQVAIEALTATIAHAACRAPSASAAQAAKAQSFEAQATASLNTMRLEGPARAVQADYQQFSPKVAASMNQILSAMADELMAQLGADYQHIPPNFAAFGRPIISALAGESLAQYGKDLLDQSTRKYLQRELFRAMALRNYALKLPFNSNTLYLI